MTIKDKLTKDLQGTRCGVPSSAKEASLMWSGWDETRALAEAPGAYLIFSYSSKYSPKVGFYVDGKVRKIFK